MLEFRCFQCRQIDLQYGPWFKRCHNYRFDYSLAVTAYGQSKMFTADYKEVKVTVGTVTPAMGQLSGTHTGHDPFLHRVCVCVCARVCVCV